MAAMAPSSILGIYNCPTLTNEPFVNSPTNYAPGSAERKLLIQALKDLEKDAPYEIDPNVNGKDVLSTATEVQLYPFKHKMALAKYSSATPELVEKAIEDALAAIFFRAAALMQTTYKYKMMAATMLGHGKNAYQADIDCTAESIDFLEIFPSLAEGLYKTQPPFNAPGVWNRTEVRPIDGFVYSISPFNFTALAVNLVLAPLILFNHIMIEAGLQAGVLQFLPGDAELVTQQVFNSCHLGGLHFTGSKSVFRSLVSQLGQKMDFWKSYPRVVGETSGKNFHLIHTSTDIRNASQKCSALSRVYVAASVAEEFKAIVVKETKQLTMGAGFTDFIGPLISSSAFDRVSRYTEDVKEDLETTILVGGEYDDTVGYFIRPTVLETVSPQSKFLKEEIFGPFLCLYIYKDEDFGPGVFKLIDETSEYALSGSIFSKDRAAIIEATEELRFSAGNFYINDQCTGAMPGHQPFGGSRGSGTNDKAGSSGLLTRFISQRTIKENFNTIDSVLYPSNLEE